MPGINWSLRTKNVVVVGRPFFATTIDRQTWDDEPDKWTGTSDTHDNDFRQSEIDLIHQLL